MNEDKVTLSLSIDYLKHWTLNMALRELFQNAIDRQAQGEEYKMTWLYNPETSILVIKNRNTVIKRQSLALGKTSKDDDSTALGQFGEGYKLAMLILARNKHLVEVINGDELWTAGFSYSEMFETDMLYVMISKLSNKKVNHDIEFHVNGITQEEFDAYKMENLYLQRDYGKIDTENCEILTDSVNNGKIFIGGLYICPYHGNTLYGYNFEVGIFQLGRDRQMIDGYDASWQASKAVTDAILTKKEVLEQVIQAREVKMEDTRFLAQNANDVLTNAFWEVFSKEYPDCLPIKYSFDADELSKKYFDFKFHVVGEKQYDILVKSDGYEKLRKSLKKRPKPDSPLTIINRFYDDNVHIMSEELKKEYAKIIMVSAIDWKVVE